MTYADKIKKVLPRDMHRLYSRLNSPTKLQDYLDTLPINFELSGETNLSPYHVFSQKTAHCFEGAVFAASVLAFHGEKPLLLDFATTHDDEDHTVALFKHNNRWGAISKTNHAILQYRDPVYTSSRELAMSYFHEYFMHDGRKSLRAYSAPFDVSRFAPEKWVMSGESLDWLMTRVAQSRYFPVMPEKNIRRIRRASEIERKILKFVSYRDSR